jgi:uncharacterized protein HemX
VAISASDLSALLVGVAGAGGGAYAAMMARRSAHEQASLAARAQDKSDFDSITRAQEAQIVTQRDQIADLRTTVAAENARHDAIVQTLQMRILAYTRYVRGLVSEMRKADIPVPEPPDDIDIPIF